MSNQLILHLKEKYYIMIAENKKTTEYREYKPYWISRIKDQKRITFVLGYVCDTCWCLDGDIKNISVVSKKCLPDYVKQEFVKSKYNQFFKIDFVLDRFKSTINGSEK